MALPPGEVFDHRDIAKVENAWEEERDITVHGWIYGILKGPRAGLDSPVDLDERLGEAAAGLTRWAQAVGWVNGAA